MEIQFHITLFFVCNFSLHYTHFFYQLHAFLISWSLLHYLQLQSWNENLIGGFHTSRIKLLIFHQRLSRQKITVIFFRYIKLRNKMINFDDILCNLVDILTEDWWFLNIRLNSSLFPSISRIYFIWFIQFIWISLYLVF